ncbi:DUF2189 domain-containing protein [Limnohabitans sp.]|uniref:DUF2189 domain-containing protein n=1 Tax=Limnohabitans sp. TaxID=1907725 RepID=UPI003341BD34
MSQDSPPSEPPATPGRLNLPGVLPIDDKQPLVWLCQGLKDIGHSPWLSLAHGLVMAIGGGLIAWLAHDRFWLLVSAVSGFLVVAPVLATSLYAMSRAIERNESVTLRLLFKTWTQWQTLQNDEAVSYWCLVRFGLLLALAGTGWVLTSSALITLLAPVPIHTPMDFIRHVVLNPDSYLFELWLMLGGLMAAPVFASSVVAIPLLLDRQLNTLQAVLTSWKVVLTHPMPMVLWAFLIMGLSMVGILSFFIGLIVIVPMLGHASWHAYRHLVDTRDVPERIPRQESE